MDIWIQWGITTVIAIIGLLAGRYWGLHDRQRNHDKEVLQEILETTPSDGAISFIKIFDFGDSFTWDEIKELTHLVNLAERVEYRFMTSLQKRLDEISHIYHSTNFQKINIIELSRTQGAKHVQEKSKTLTITPHQQRRRTA